MLANVIIIGNGPAGISAALYTARAGIATTVIGRDGGALEKADRIENYYGFAAPVSGRELIQNGIAQATKLSVNILREEVVGIGYTDKFIVSTAAKEYAADSVIIATGSQRKAPDIPGLKEYEGRGVSYCAVCDAFFYRKKDVAVLGCCEYALHEALELLPVAHSVTMITNGAQPIPNIPAEITVNTKEIARFTGADQIEYVAFKDASQIAISGVFVAIGVAGSSDFAKKIGAQVDGNRIVVDEHMATNIPGIFAAGDCTGGMLQIAKAVYQGAQAGSEAVRYLRKVQGNG